MMGNNRSYVFKEGFLSSFIELTKLEIRILGRLIVLANIYPPHDCTISQVNLAKSLGRAVHVNCQSGVESTSGCDIQKALKHLCILGYISREKLHTWEDSSGNVRHAGTYYPHYFYEYKLLCMKKDDGMLVELHPAINSKSKGAL